MAKFYKKRKSYKRKAPRKKKTGKWAQKWGTRQSFAPVISAGVISQSKTVRFTFSRQYCVSETDPGQFPKAIFYANSLFNPFVTSTGSWQLQNGASTSDNVPNINEWLSNQSVGGEGDTAKYREAFVASSSIKVSAIPMQQTASTSDSYQDNTGIIVHRGTQSTDWPGATIDSDTNYRTLSRMGNTVVGSTRTNPNGAPQGCTVSARYKFTDSNALRTSGSAIIFRDTHPAEKDYFYVGLTPMNTAEHSTIPIAKHLVNIDFTYYVKLSEPNTSLQTNGDGFRVPMRAVKKRRFTP